MAKEPKQLEEKFSYDSVTGVARMNAILKVMSTRERFVFLFCVWLLAWVYVLDNYTRLALQTYATASFEQHSLLATINVLTSIIAVAAQPTYGKIADVFGRLEILIISIFLYMIGTIIEATSTNIEAFATGAVIWRLGFSGILFLVSLILADISTFNWRLFFLVIPISPYIAYVWASGNYIERFSTNWRWGIALFAFLVPVMSLPVVGMLYYLQRKALRIYPENNNLKNVSIIRRLISLFWKLDLIGMILIIASLALTLVPLTLAGGSNSNKENWTKAKILAPLVIGVCLFILFLYWQRKAKYPMFPVHLLRQKTVWASLAVFFIYDFAWDMQGTYLFAVLQLSINQSILSAQRIGNLYTFVSTFTVFVLSVFMIRIRRIKYFIVSGLLIMLIAFGLLIRYRAGSSSYAGVVSSQVILGCGAGLVTYPLQVALQADVPHENLAVAYGIALAFYNIGLSVGSAVSGAVWTQLLPNQLLKHISDSKVALSVYKDPYTFIANYNPTTPERIGATLAYKHVSRILYIIGICSVAVALIFSFFLSNTYLAKEFNAPSQKDSQGSTETLNIESSNSQSPQVDESQKA